MDWLGKTIDTRWLILPLVLSVLCPIWLYFAIEVVWMGQIQSWYPILPRVTIPRHLRSVVVGVGACAPFVALLCSVVCLALGRRWIKIVSLITAIINAWSALLVVPITLQI
jgi:hypothetical protein